MENPLFSFAKLKYIVDEFYINSQNLQSLVFFSKYLPSNQLFHLINILNWNMNIIYQEYFFKLKHIYYKINDKIERKDKKFSEKYLL